MYENIIKSQMMRVRLYFWWHEEEGLHSSVQPENLSHVFSSQALTLSLTHFLIVVATRFYKQP